MKVDNLTQNIELNIILTVKTAAFLCKCDELRKCVSRGRENEHTGIEAVRPADIRCSGQLLAFEQLIAVLDHLTTNILLTDTKKKYMIGI